MGSVSNWIQCGETNYEYDNFYQVMPYNTQSIILSSDYDNDQIGFAVVIIQGKWKNLIGE